MTSEVETLRAKILRLETAFVLFRSAFQNVGKELEDLAKIVDVLAEGAETTLVGKPDLKLIQSGLDLADEHANNHLGTYCPFPEGNL